MPNVKIQMTNEIPNPNYRLNLTFESIWTFVFELAFGFGH